MTAVLILARTGLRARLAAVLALALLLGLSSGAVITLAAGARRTDSAYGRFAREYKAADLIVFPPFDDSFAALDFDKVAALPQVAASARQRFLGSTDQKLLIIGGDKNLGKTVDRLRILEGRTPREDSLDEVAISFPLANVRRLKIGSVLSVRFTTRKDRFIPARLRVVGIEAAPGEFPPLLSDFGSGKGGGVVHVSSALFDSLAGRDVFTFDFLLLRLRRGSIDFPALNDGLNALSNGKPQINQNLDAQATNVQRSIHLQAAALRIVAGLVALIALLVLSQLIARQASFDATDTPALLALGMTRRQISLAGLWRSAVIGIIGAIIGAITSLAASPLMPIGTARFAEPREGISFDPLVIGVGALGAIVVALALAAWPLWKNARRLSDIETGLVKPSIVSRSAAPFSPAVSAGVSLALESGRGPTAVPVRSSLTSVALAIVGLAGALTFGAGLAHLLNSPRQYGWNWDAHVTTGDNDVTIDRALKAVDADPAVESVILVDTPPVTLRGVRFEAIAMKQHKGSLGPRVLEGRSPRAANEIALGARTARDAHAGIGSKVHMSIAAIAGGGADFHVVGTVVIPPNSDSTRLGSGGVITYDGELAMAPPGFKNIPPITDAYFRFAPGVNKTKALARLEDAWGSDYDLTVPERPVDLINFGQVQNLPLLLGGLVGLLAAATLAHTLVTSIRRRRRDLAILKMLGFVPRQVRSAVAWQATTFVLAALVVGLPVGVVVGRLIWTAFAHQLGTPPDPVTPSIQLLLTIPAAVVLANVVAAIPAVIAGRMKPAVGLRAE